MVMAGRRYRFRDMNGWNQTGNGFQVTLPMSTMASLKCEPNRVIYHLKISAQLNHVNGNYSNIAASEFGHKFEIRSQLHNAHHPKSIGDKTIIDLNFKVTILTMGYTLLYSCFPQYFPPMSFVDTIHWIVIIIAEVCSSWLLGSLIISHLKRVRYYHYWLFEHKVILFSCRFRSSHYTVLCTFHLNKSQSSELDVIKGATTAELLLAYKMLKEEFQLAEMRFVQDSMQAFNANWICIN